MYLSSQLLQTVSLVQRSISALCAIWPALFLMAACTTAVGPLQPPSTRANPAELRIGDVLETATGKVITMDQLIDILSKVSIVYTGETHTSAEDHSVQLAILQQLSRGGRCVELAMEMFPVSAQPVLDKYIHGGMSEEEFLKEVEWEQTWGFPYSLYRGLINWQKEKHLPVLGLNAPNKIVRKIAHSGLDSLTPDERLQVAGEFHLDDPANRKRIQKEYVEHQRGAIKNFETFFEAQLAWEETMAQTLTRQVQQKETGCIIMAAIGKGHIDDRLGVPYLARLRTPHEYKTVAPVPIDYPFSTLDPDLADYVIITDRSEPFHRPRLGITIQPAPSGRGIEILGVLGGTPAALAHLSKGDIILSVDGSPVNSIEEIHQVLARGGSQYKILIERDKKKMTITVTAE